MKRLIIKSGCSVDPVVAKGITVDESSQDLTALIERVQHLFEDPDIIGLKAEGEVDIVDLEFVQDGDRLTLVRKNEDQDLNTSVHSDLGSNAEWITLNVGGKTFTTTRSTLCQKAPDSVLARMFGNDFMAPCHRDRHGHYLIDRTPSYFEPILNFLRTGTLVIDPGTNVEGVFEEAK